MWSALTRRPAYRRSAICLAAPNRSVAAGMRVEHEKQRKRACAYLAIWHVHRARIFGSLRNTRPASAAGLALFDPALPEEVTCRSKLTTAWRTPTRALDDFRANSLLAA
jgi:hypothetical protein